MADPELSGEVGLPEGVFDHLSEVEEAHSEDNFSNAKVQLLLGQVDETLTRIFEYYASQGNGALKEPRLTSAKFMRMVMDATLLDSKLTSAKVDVTFARVCKGAQHMQLQQFRDAVVRLAALKYPEQQRTEAVLHMFNEYLAAFQGHAAEGVFSELDADELAVLALAAPSLSMIYEGYFAASQFRRQAAESSLAQKSKSLPDKVQARNSLKASNDATSDAQQSLLSCLTDFEVVPSLVAKSACFSTFREVSKQSSVPDDIKMQVAPNEAPGRFFTYAHFACTIGLISHRAFAQTGVTAVMRLLFWMDSSKGRLKFATNYPGYGPKGSPTGLRLMPDAERLPESILESLPPELVRSRNTEPGKLDSSFTSGTDKRASMSRSTSQGSLTGGRTGGGKPERPSLSSSATLPVPEWAKLECQKTFSHYAALGDPLNRTTLTSQKFGRCLRDCGLLSMQASGAISFGFSPEGRSVPATPNSSKKEGSKPDLAVPDLGATPSRGSMSRSSSAGSLAGRKSVKGASFSGSPQDQKRFTISQALLDQLPLQVSAVPPLTQVEADLIFVQATRSAGPDRRGSVSAGPDRRGSVGASKSTNSKLMTVETFMKALQDIARRCMPPEDVSGVFEDFCQKVIIPLNEVLLSSRSEELSRALEISITDGVRRLMSAAAPGLEKLFLSYTVDGSQRRPFWNAESVSRFSTDFDFLSEVGNLPLQRMFQDCSHHESNTTGSVDGEMTLTGLPLMMIMLAQKIHTSQANSSPEERVTNLFRRINAVGSTGAFGFRVGLGQDQLLPLPKSADNEVQTRTRGSTFGLEKRGSPEVDMAWSDLVQKPL
eukprot:CAMPEP_0197622666 /NCGR_PEP_ID=MMETSP1338-20131121/2871_1 /TAXON_ID=43686 ORGANISM="Pelagodinium beii, Strain RCC1491" /NCGR_SAMPLE_ID=MMETSP1338 /ASSEMBLY_ACC=CAM_ASM_000754 /LENGTH=827 /DNA_ID=CAMNT_0043192413 /DNA_START=47 /DNA_END=2530 /DNA_ORIENTATION=-